MCWGFHYQTVNNCKKRKQDKKDKDASGANVPPTPTNTQYYLIPLSQCNFPQFPLPEIFLQHFSQMVGKLKEKLVGKMRENSKI